MGPHRPTSKSSVFLREIRRELAHGGAEFSPGDNPRFRVLVANSRELRTAAWGLVYRSYLERGYMTESELAMRILPQDALPEVSTFLAQQAPDWAPAATLTVVPDSPLGLPMDALYRRDLDTLRGPGRKPCEIAKLVMGEAGTGEDAKPDVELLLALFRIAYITARYLEGCTDFVITVNPHHEKYYRRLMRFERLGEPRTYGSVRGAVAVPMRLDLLAAEATYRQKADIKPTARSFYAYFLDEAQRPALLTWLRRERRVMPEADLRHFFAERTSLLREMTAEQRMYLQGCYLHYDLDEDTQLQG
ncbi:MAG TPA: hypothetical protein PK280_05240 [Planctomycetota bacterium]|nr:hypothetical protein [Planctomycetota bacterium]